MNDLVLGIGIVVEERVDVLLGVRDRLPGRERRRKARLAGHVSHEDEALRLRLGGQRRVLGRADLVVDLDGVPARGRLAVDLRDRLRGRPRMIERRAGGVDRRPEELARGDPRSATRGTPAGRSG